MPASVKLWPLPVASFSPVSDVEGVAPNVPDIDQ